MLESKQLNEEEEFDLKWSAASLYSGKLTLLSLLSFHRFTYPRTGASDTVRDTQLHRNAKTNLLSDCLRDLLFFPRCYAAPRDCEEGSSRNRQRRRK